MSVAKVTQPSNERLKPWSFESKIRTLVTILNYYVLIYFIGHGLPKRFQKDFSSIVLNSPSCLHYGILLYTADEYFNWCTELF